MATTRRKAFGQRPASAPGGSAARAYGASATENDMLDDLPVAALVVSPTRSAVTCNRAWTELTGLAAPASVGHGWLEAIHPDSFEDAMSAVAAAATRSGVVS